MSCIYHAFAPVHAALWTPAGKGLTSLLLFVMFICVLVTFLCGILGQVWYLIVSISNFSTFLSLCISLLVLQVKCKDQMPLKQFEPL